MMLTHQKLSIPMLPNDEIPTSRKTQIHPKSQQSHQSASTKKVSEKSFSTISCNDDGLSAVSHSLQMMSKETFLVIFMLVKFHPFWRNAK